MRPQTASRLARLAPLLLAAGLLLGACVTTASPGWTFEPPPAATSPSAPASGSAAPSGSVAPSGSASAAPSGSVAPSASASGSASASASVPPSGSAGPTIALSAANTAFDKTQLEAPAGQAFHIAFTNNDSSVQHNVQIKAPDGSRAFSGSLLTGPGSVTYDIGALAAGTYTFSCVVHPAMTGTLTVK
jgi:plastocyanin